MIQRTLIFIIFGLLVWSCNTTNGNGTNKLSKDQIDSLRRIECDSLLEELDKANDSPYKKVKIIPADFEGCMKQLDSMTSDKMKEWIKCLPDRDFSVYVHGSFGMYLRNSWGLWRDTKLARNLYEMGILHPDDMTAIILDSYQRKLKGEDIKLQEQLKYYQDFWRNSGVNVDSVLLSFENKKKKG